MKKALIIRFSSFGDIFHGLEAAAQLHDNGFEVHWATRSDYVELIEGIPEIKKVWGLNRNTGFSGLIKLAKSLNSENFTHVYDAHNNLRSFILGILLKKTNFVRRSKNRWKRILLFKFSKNTFPKPYFSVESFIEPIKHWLEHVNFKKRIMSFNSVHLNADVLSFLNHHNSIVIAPSAAWELKRWPTESWKELIKKLPNFKFLILGGPEDDFCKDIKQEDPQRVLNLAGSLSLIESAAVVSKTRLMIAGDTGLMHLANHLSVNTVALIGPSAFGFPHRESSKILCEKLYCQPCSKDGRGRCKNKTYKKCMIDISSDKVIKTLNSLKVESH